MTTFDILKDIITIKSRTLCDNPSFENDFNPYMIARYLSMRKDLMLFAEWMNQYSRVLTKKNMYLFLVDNIPQSKNSFVHYIKKNKKEKKK